MAERDWKEEEKETNLHHNLLLHHHPQRQPQPKITPLHLQPQLFLRCVPLLQPRLQGVCRARLHSRRRGGRGQTVPEGIMDGVERVGGGFVGDVVGC